MTPRTPEECTLKGSWPDHVSKLFGSHSCDNNLQDVHRPPDSSGQQAHRSSCNGNCIVADAEWMEQVEPGVYITVFRSPAGQKYLRRVRFRYWRILAPSDSNNSQFLVLVIGSLSISYMSLLDDEHFLYGYGFVHIAFLVYPSNIAEFDHNL